MAEFDQRGQQVNKQFNAENITILSADNERIKSFLESEIKKYTKMDFLIVARSNSKAILSRQRRASIGDWFKLLGFFWKLIVVTVRQLYKIQTQLLNDERLDDDMQRIGKSVLSMGKDWVQIEIDTSENVKITFEPPLLGELERLKGG
ncbi:MAG: hypothetical protein HYU84_10885 [Chloroflexi bacterium]|nr:hypothetical protein [Chloroflexota bacterium]MBI3173404.1 hypothetical protein [Chloroflexota bacterium]